MMKLSRIKTVLKKEVKRKTQIRKLTDNIFNKQFVLLLVKKLIIAVFT